MIIRSVASAYTKTNPTEPVHVVDKVHRLFFCADTWHVVLTGANLIAGLSDRNVANAGLRLSDELLVLTSFIHTPLFSYFYMHIYRSRLFLSSDSRICGREHLLPASLESNN